MLLIYGANGYTGRLVVEECVRRGIRPILAGRQRAVLEPLALAYGLDVRVSALTAAHSAGPRPTPHGTLPASPSAELLAILEGITVVLHCAGPFVHTSAIMVQACLAAGAHYLDITGEISVFEACRQQDLAARQRGTVVLPGVGFDVVPTDCLAMRLAEALPGGSLLELAFAGGGGVSRGTLKTMLLNGSGGAIRREGTIVPVPTAWRTRTIPFHDRPRTAVTIPWGDVSTAQWSTRIPTIHTYIALPTAARIGMRLQSVAQPLLHLPGLRRFLERQIDRRVAGPDAVARSRATMQLWGRVTHPDGRDIEGTAVTPEGYRFTALAAVESARRLLSTPPAPGYHTPATAFGSHFLESLPECRVTLGPISCG